MKMAKEVPKESQWDRGKPRWGGWPEGQVEKMIQGRALTTSVKLLICQGRGG